MEKLNMFTFLLAKAYTDKKAAEVPAVIQYKGVTTTELTDGATTNPITINGSSYTATNGDTVFYNGVAFTYDGDTWQETLSLAEIITTLETIQGEIDDIQDGVSIDSFSEVETALSGKQDALTFDSVPTDGSTNPVESNGIFDALALKQDILTFDNAPTENSNNPVKSGGVYAADKALEEWTSAETKSKTGNPITINDGAALNAKGLVMSIEPIQAGSGTPSPENVRAISGISSAEVQTEGKNLFNEVYPDISSSVKRVYLYVGNGTFTMSTTTPLAGGSSANLFFVGGEFTGDVSTSTDGVSNGVSRTVTSIDGYVTVAYRNNGNIDPRDYETQIERGSTATAYTPYVAPKTATISLGGTVYGGTVDFNTGVLTVDRAIVEYDGSEDESWLLDDSGANYFFYIELTGRDSSKEVIANNCVYTSISKVTTNLGVGTDARYLRYRYANDNSLTVSDLKTFLASNNLQVCYYIATPTTTQLTPAQLELLKGYNTVTANGASISLVYQPENLKGDILEEVQPQIDTLAAAIPAAPTTDGTYNLVCTVSSGAASYTWESTT